MVGHSELTWAAGSKLRVVSTLHFDPVASALRGVGGARAEVMERAYVAEYGAVEVEPSDALICTLPSGWLFEKLPAPPKIEGKPNDFGVAAVPTARICTTQISLERGY